jgi:hypothetical protein
MIGFIPGEASENDYYTYLEKGCGLSTQYISYDSQGEKILFP